ncbi:hypothetical protein AYI69_g5557 [Smittium culicis]|uniref:Uncharacterized protein n=1 Tax=Smittium culicis TaxID=133412 RepID=A0A1R1Y4Z3_9FUNG|nr:hypothetical protein AYI69_g5557 [Smittium culicis]
MGKGSNSLPKSWYWDVQPAKFVATHFGTVHSNWTGKNQKACFRCGECKVRYSVSEFYLSILKGSEEKLPAETGLDSIQLPHSPRKKVDPAQPIYLDLNSKKIPGDNIGLAAIKPGIMGSIGERSVSETPGELVVSDTEAEVLLDMEIEAAVSHITFNSEYLENFKAVVWKDTTINKKLGLPCPLIRTPESSSGVDSLIDSAGTIIDTPSGSNDKEHASAGDISPAISSYFNKSLFGDFSPIKQLVISGSKTQLLSDSDYNSRPLSDFIIKKSAKSNKRLSHSSSRSSKRPHISISIYVTNDAFSHRMNLHLNDVKEKIKKNRSPNQDQIQKLQEENKFLQKQLAIQTKRIDRLTQQSKNISQQPKQMNSLPNFVPATVPTTQSISFNFGTHANPVSLPPQNLNTNGQMSY